MRNAFALLALLWAGSARAEAPILLQGLSGGVHHMPFEVIKDASRLSEIWFRHADEFTSPPAVDFNGEAVVAIYLGRRDAPVRVRTRLIAFGGGLTVFYSEERVPAAGRLPCEPFVLVRVPRAQQITAEPEARFTTLKRPAFR